MKKTLKNLTVLATIIMSLCILTVFAYAEEHAHNWEMTQSNGSVTLQCSDCNTQVLMYSNSILCEHEFESFGSSVYEGEHCIHCGYTVQNRHQFETFFENGVHIAECIDCGHTESHPTSVVRDEAGHSFVCQICDECQTQPEEHSFDNFEDDCQHGKKCVVCSYSIAESHDMVDAGFVDGFHIMECTGCNYTEYHSITEWTDEGGHYTSCDVCGETIVTDHEMYDASFDGLHVLECELCDYTEYHPVSESVDEAGHHIICDVCDSGLSIWHEKDVNMFIKPFNDTYHVYECVDCGYVECEVHNFFPSDLENGTCICETNAGSCSHSDVMYEQNDSFTHSVICNICGNHSEENHILVADGANRFCIVCDYTLEPTIQYGIIVDSKEIDGTYFVDLLSNGKILTFKAWDMTDIIGDFVKAMTSGEEITTIWYMLDYEVVNDITNISFYVHNALYFPYQIQNINSITVESVMDDCITFKSGNATCINQHSAIIYDMTKSDMSNRKVNAEDKIVFFTTEDNETIILIVE